MRNANAFSLSETIPDDRELVFRLRQGDRAAFGELVRRHRHTVYRVALRMMRNEASASDVVQDAFVQVFRKIDQFQFESAFSTWLHRVTVNAALMRLRAPHHRRETSLDESSPRYGDAGEIVEPVDDWSTAVDDVVIRRELCVHAGRAVDELPEIYRSVFVLRELEDLSTEEVARLLQITVPMVKTRLHRARLRLRKALTAKLGAAVS